MRKVIQFAALLGGTVALLLVLRATGRVPFDARQILSVTIFSTFIYGTLLFGEFRLAFAFGGIALLMASNLITVRRFTEAASLDVLVFLIGTFLVIGFLEESRFFEHVVSGIVGRLGPRPQVLLLTLTVIASLASALVGEVTAILFMSGAMLHLTSRYKLQPAPFIIVLVFACNNGSAMSSVGNPIGVLIALKTGLSFVDFLKWAAPTALVVDVAMYVICRWWFAEAFAQFDDAMLRDFEARRRRRAAASASRRRAVESAPAALVMAGGDETAVAVESATGTGGGGAASPLGKDYFTAGDVETVDGLDLRKTYRLCWGLLGLLVALLATHGLTERLLGLHEGTMMVAAALVMGSVVLFIQREKARELVERRVDWWTLAFFMMLFASVGTLEDTRVTRVIADQMKGIGGGQLATVQVIGWATGWLSAFLDNVLAVATFMPIVHDIRAAAAPAQYTSAVYWFMLFGGTFMGNMTIIGSTANIVAVGLLEKRGHGTIRFGYWMKIGLPVSIASMVVATTMLLAMSRLPGAMRMPDLAPPQVQGH
ncbi:MAG TPA: SLC13 family permease [Tepidisphaeraceae bacterium]